MVVGIVENVEMVGDNVTGVEEGCEVVGVLEGEEVVGVLDGCEVVGVFEGREVVGDKDGCGVVGDLEGVFVVGGVGVCVAPVYTQMTDASLLHVWFPFPVKKLDVDPNKPTVPRVGPTPTVQSKQVYPVAKFVINPV
jgi:hypothetical protein